MPFVSDAQRKHFFANVGGSGGGVPSFPDLTTAQMDAKENAYAEYWDSSPDFVRNPGFKNPMPQMTAEESAAWQAGCGLGKK